MTAVRVAWSRLLGMLTGRRREHELTEEIQAHLDLLVEEHIRAGMSPQNAHVAARRDFGSVELTKESYRDQRGWPFVGSIVQDARFALRLLAKDRRFTMGAVIALALGISVNNMVFTFVNAVMFRDLPLEDPHELVAFNTRDGRGREVGVSYADFKDWKQVTRAFSGIAASTGTAMNLSDSERAPERFRGLYTSPDAFPMYGVRPILGRVLSADDEKPGAPAVTVLTDRVWRMRYDEDPALVGRTVRVNGVPSTVVGIVRADVKSPLMNYQVMQPLPLFSDLADARRDTRTLNVDGRLRHGVTLEQAQAELRAVGERLGQEYPDTNRGMTPVIVPLKQKYGGGLAPVMVTLMAAVGLVLLIACANVANLLLARSAGRSHEIAIRASLGANRWRVTRQLLIESVTLAAIGGVVGLLLSVYFVRLFSVAFEGKEIGGTETFTPFWIDLSMNWRVFAFLAAICLGSSVLFGLAPALHLSRTNVHDLLKDGARGAGGGIRARRWTGALMIAELALAVVLLASAGLMVRSVLTVYRAGMLFDTADLVTMRLALPVQTYQTAEQRKSFFERLDDRLAAEPGIAGVALVSDLPFVPGGARRGLSLDGRPPASGTSLPIVTYLDIDARYFATLRVPLLRGRAFRDTDGLTGEQPAIVNQRLATTFFPDVDPIGQRIQLGPANTSGPAPAPPAWFTIVGVAPTIPQYTIPNNAGTGSEPVVYVHFRGEPAPNRIAALIARGRAGAIPTASIIRNAVRDLDPDLPLYFVRSMDDVVDEMRFQIRGMTSLIALLAGIAFVLAVVGLYAVTAHAVTQRTTEIGVRIALGARTRQVIWPFLRRTLVQVAIGLALGLAGAFAIGKILRAILIQTSARDPLTLALVAVLLVLVALIACLIPARRAARLDPAVTLRYE